MFILYRFTPLHNYFHKNMRAETYFNYCKVINILSQDFVLCGKRCWGFGRSLKRKIRKITRSSLHSHMSQQKINENIWAAWPRPLRRRSVARRTLWASMGNSQTVSSSSVRFLPCSFTSVFAVLWFSVRLQQTQIDLTRVSAAPPLARIHTGDLLGVTSAGQRTGNLAPPLRTLSRTRLAGHIFSRTPAGKIRSTHESQFAPHLFVLLSNHVPHVALGSGPYPLTPILFSIFSP